MLCVELPDAGSSDVCVCSLDRHLRFMCVVTCIDFQLSYKNIVLLAVLLMLSMISVLVSFLYISLLVDVPIIVSKNIVYNRL